MINISSTRRTIERVRQLKANLLYVDSVPIGEMIRVNRIGTVTPLSIAPLVARMHAQHRIINHNDPKARSLKVIDFPEGLLALQAATNANDQLPTIALKLASLSSHDRSSSLLALHSNFLELLRRKVISEPTFIELVSNNTLGFIIGEMLDNVAEHSLADNAYVFAKYWPEEEACEICILDDGVGLRESLRRANLAVADDMDALRKVIGTGLSSKSDFGNHNRGMGIWSTHAATINRELSGEFLMMSGKAVFLDSLMGGANYVTFDEPGWNGTVVMMKLNRPKSAFNLYDYVQ